jgi:hypothetical protein
MELTVVGGSRESRPGRARHTGASSGGRGWAASGRKVRATIGVFATMYDHQGRSQKSTIGGQSHRFTVYRSYNHSHILAF